MKKLSVLYDAECELCRRCRAFLLVQPAYIPLEFIPLQTLDLEVRFPGIGRLQPDREMIAIDDAGNVWQGGAAWIMCLYALREYREWSFRLSTPAFLPLAKKIVSGISRNRHFLSRLMRKSETVALKHLQEKPIACACES